MAPNPGSILIIIIILPDPHPIPPPGTCSQIRSIIPRRVMAPFHSRFMGAASRLLGPVETHHDDIGGLPLG